MTDAVSWLAATQFETDWSRRLAVPVARQIQEFNGADVSDHVALVGLSIDSHLDNVERDLLDRGIPVLRVNVDEVCANGGVSIGLPGAAMNVRAVLFRSADPFEQIAHHNERSIRALDPLRHVPPDHREFVRVEAEAAIHGMLGLLRTDRWVNNVANSQAAESKPSQLAVAADCGLRIPRTLISDDAATIRDFYDSVGGSMIYKTLRTPITRQSAGRASFVYTSTITPSDLPPIGARCLSSGIYQERLYPISEFRVTIVGTRVFTAATARSPGGAECAPDWRRDIASGREFQVASLPASIEAGVLDVVSSLGLSFAGVDLLKDEEGFCFLELNPSAAYSWLERSLDLPITKSLCDLLLDRPTSR